MGVSAALTSYAWWLLGQSTAFPVARHRDAYFELQWSNGLSDSVLDNGAKTDRAGYCLRM